MFCQATLGGKQGLAAASRSRNRVQHGWARRAPGAASPPFICAQQHPCCMSAFGSFFFLLRLGLKVFKMVFCV